MDVPNHLETARERMRHAGADAFNLGKPCVPGLDCLWTRELYGNAYGKYAMALSQSWRHGWKQQAALVERVRSKRPCPEMAFDGFTFFDCAGTAGHAGECQKS